jgi:endonuclease/exonuclease/phosphatase family metal-dependent hydrolase
MNAFRKILHSLILTINFGVVLLLLVSGYAYLIKPEHTMLLSFLGYAFPLLALVNILFLFYWAIRLKWWILVSIAGLILTIDSYQAWFPVHWHEKETTEETLKVLSYNVMFLSYIKDLKPGELNPVIRYIRDLDADIVCLQEVGPDFIQKGRFSPEVQKALSAYKYIVSGADENRYSVVCLSKYKVIRHKRIKYESKSNSSFYYDIKIGHDTLRVINNHLESNKLNREEKDKYTDFLKKRESEQLTKVAEVLGSKVGNASVIRANQADAVSEVVLDSPYKVILCGDFNDIPGSYTYRKIRKGLRDAWVEKGNGWGLTFHENLFLFRIDYIMHSPKIDCLKAKVDKVRYSDHYPVWANLKLR